MTRDINFKMIPSIGIIWQNFYNNYDTNGTVTIINTFKMDGNTESINKRKLKKGTNGNRRPQQTP